MPYIKPIIVICSLLASTTAIANCYSISNADNKNVCLAKNKRQSSYCYSVNNSDLKNNCLAQVKHERSYCYSIKNNDLKNECLALLKTN